MPVRQLYSPPQIQRSINRLAKQIAADYRGKPLILIGILRGGFIVLADLVRALWLAGHHDLDIDFITTSSYLESNISAQVPPKIIVDLNRSLAGQHVLIVEDICDTGLTLNLVQKQLRAAGPKSLKTFTFLDKPSRRQVPVKLDYIGFTVNGWIEGYGLDADRACPSVVVKT